LRDAGFEEVGAEAHQAIVGGEASRELLSANIAQVADQLVDQQMVTRDDLRHYL
jgi:hypothetical protein